MKADAFDPCINFPPTDEDGPRASAFRMWVKVATKVNFQEYEDRQKKVQQREKELKNLSQGDIDALHKRALMDHQATAGAVGSQRTPEEMAKMLLKSGHSGPGSAGA